jgi:mono/diheme cytochrome c family protein
MRKATLHRTTGALVAVLLATAVSMAVLRNTVFLPDEKEGLSHTHAGKEDHLPQATLGKELFENAGCSQCHFIDSVRTKIGPGLKGLFDRTELPASHRPVNEENVMRQLEDPYENMPSFRERLTPDERARIISYLKTL